MDMQIMLPIAGEPGDGGDGAGEGGDEADGGE